MPVYEYECGVCQCRFEKRQSFNDKLEATCPTCQGRARKVFYPAPIIFKGSGFYVTDSRKATGPEVSKETKPSASGAVSTPAKDGGNGK